MQLEKCAHFFSSFHTLGGVESVLRHHYANDDKWGLSSSVICHFEDDLQPLERVFFLGFSPRTTIQQARQRSSAALAQIQPELAVYHSAWGMTYLADLDRCQRRIVVLHSAIPGLRDLLISRRDWIDGVLCVNEPLRKLAEECLPDLGENRIGLLPYPVLAPAIMRTRSSFSRRPLVLGFSGRLQIEQKRVDRFPDLCRRLDQLGLSYRLEFLGDGPARDLLERQFPDRSKFQFHGRLSGEDYLRVLGGWDFVLFLSSYEGTPIALLEALGSGAIPLYPKIGSGGDCYVRQIRSDLLYEPDDFSGLAQTLLVLTGLADEQIQQLRARCREAISPHLGDAYLAKFSAFARFILSAPRVSSNSFPRRPWFIDHLPFFLLDRLGLMRRFLRRLLGK